MSSVDCALSVAILLSSSLIHIPLFARASMMSFLYVVLHRNFCFLQQCRTAYLYLYLTLSA